MSKTIYAIIIGGPRDGEVVAIPEGMTEVYFEELLDDLPKYEAFDSTLLPSAIKTRIRCCPVVHHHERNMWGLDWNEGRLIR